MKSPKSQFSSNYKFENIICTVFNGTFVDKVIFGFFGSLDHASSVFSNRVSGGDLPKMISVVLLMLSLIEANNFGNNRYKLVTCRRMT